MAYDLLIRNVRVVRPDADEPEPGDIAVSGGRIAEVGRGLPRTGAADVVDGDGMLALPGVVDAHQHWGIHNALEEDAVTESRAAAQGGVTTGITYIRTGHYYLDRAGPYSEFMPEVLERAAGRAHIDYAFHVAPMQRSHIDELGLLADDFGVTSFKIFMFYGGHGLHGRSTAAEQREFLMLPEGETYDYAHFEFIMRGLHRLRAQRPDIAEAISLSLHCENAEIMAAHTRMVEDAGELSGLSAYHMSRPPHSESVAIGIAACLAHETGFPCLNLLHLSSRAAIDAARRMARAYPDLDLRCEVTVGHLLTDIGTGDVSGKVNPPIRPRDDVEALWEAVADGTVDWVASDHACRRAHMKFGQAPDDVFGAKAGFGATEYLLPGLLTGARERGLSYGRVAALTSWNPARRYGLWHKGTIAPGYQADVVLVDPDESFVVRAEDSCSSQEYTPFEGMELTGKVRDVFLNGARILRDGDVEGEPRGRYLRRPVTR